MLIYRMLIDLDCVCDSGSPRVCITAEKDEVVLDSGA